MMRPGKAAANSGRSQSMPAKLSSEKAAAICPVSRWGRTIYTDILEEKLDPRSIPVLLKVLTYKNPKGFTSDAMIVAARALGKMKAREAADPLADIIAKDKNQLFVVAAAKALMNIDSVRARPIIRKLVDNLENDERFDRAHNPNFWAQEKAGWGTVVELKKLAKNR